MQPRPVSGLLGRPLRRSLPVLGPLARSGRPLFRDSRDGRRSGLRASREPPSAQVPTSGVTGHRPGYHFERIARPPAGEPALDGDVVALRRPARQQREGSLHRFKGAGDAGDRLLPWYFRRSSKEMAIGSPCSRTTSLVTGAILPDRNRRRAVPAMVACRRRGSATEPRQHRRESGVSGRSSWQPSCLWRSWVPLA